MSKIVETADELTEPVTIGPEAYISPDYARAEGERLWRRTWLQAGRLEEIPNTGDFITYDIGDDSVIIVRNGPDDIRAHHNVCVHRGRRLIDMPPGEKRAQGNRSRFVCGFHGWTYDRSGACIGVPEKADWKGALTSERTTLGKVAVDSWGGWVWVNLDGQAGPLRDYLEPAASMLDPFELHNMRPRWRKWLVFDCNWKVAMEAFAEIYHVNTTHPEFTAFGEFHGWARAQGLHSNIGYDAPKDMDANQQAKLRLGLGDARISTAEMQEYTWEQVNTNTTLTLVNAARRLKDELPEGTPAPQVMAHWLKSARDADAARGVIWPTVDPAHVGASGTAWQIFPNFQIGHAVNNMLCYAARPFGADPDKCVFEVAVYELYPDGEVPDAPWDYVEKDDPRWGSVLPQDFSNMAAVQAGMKSSGFRGTLPNPYRERSIANLHRNLARYMGSGEVRGLD
jgi:phenylpropionate dioxygenase-like ring-hydroxylating dioxygenase large terminal subunit